MKKKIFILFIIPLLFFSCTKDKIVSEAQESVPYEMKTIGIETCSGIEDININIYPDQNHDDYLQAIENPEDWDLPHMVIFNHIFIRKFFNVIYAMIKEDYPDFEICNIDLAVKNPYTGEIHKWFDILNYPGGFNAPLEIDKVFHLPEERILFTEFKLIDRETGADISNYPVPHTGLMFDFKGLNY